MYKNPSFQVEMWQTYEFIGCVYTEKQIKSIVTTHSHTHTARCFSCCFYIVNDGVGSLARHDSAMIHSGVLQSQHRKWFQEGAAQFTVNTETNIYTHVIRLISWHLFVSLCDHNQFWLLYFSSWFALKMTMTPENLAKLFFFFGIFPRNEIAFKSSN